MNARFVTGLVAVLAVAAAAFYFWPQNATAPVTVEPQQQTATQPTIGASATTQAQMSGTWRSNADAKFTREIRADGVMIDRYQGDTAAGVNGEWSIVDPAKETPINVPLATLAGMTVVKVEWEGGVETTYFVVNHLTDTSLTTTDLSGQGAVTIYTKVN